MLGRELDQAPPLGLRERAPGRVVEVGDHVHEPHRAPLELALQRLDVDPVRLQRDADDLGARAPEQQQGAVVGGLLDDHPVAGADEVAEDQRRRLHRAVGDHHPIGLDAVQLGRDPLAQARVPATGAVGERALPVGLQRAVGRGPDRGGGQDVGARGAAGEGDQVGGHRREPSVAAGPVGRRSPNCRRSSPGAGRGLQRFGPAQPSARIASTASRAVSVGLLPTRTPFASSASFFASAVPEEPEMIAPAWPICLPGGAVKPAM